MTVSTLRNLDVGGLSTKAEAIETLVGHLLDRAADIGTRTEPLTGWEGTAADGEKEEFRLHRRTFGAIADAVASGAPALRTAESRLHAAKQKLNDALAEAADNSDLRINDDGTIDYVGPQQGGYNPYNPGSYDPTMGATTQQGERLAGTIHDALLEAERADGDAANDLDRITQDLQAFGPPAGDRTLAAAATSVPGSGTSPAEVTRWWNSLTPTQHEALLFAHPERLGRLDGIPVLARNRANLTLLADQEGALSAERDAAQRNLDYARHVDPDGEYTQAASARLNNITGKLRGLDAVLDRLYHPNPGQQPAYLLGIDTRGTGRTLAAAGSPDTARNTLTYVPGTGSGLASSGGDMRRSDLMIQAADRVAGKDSRTAAVTWVGYDAPQDIPHAALNHYANNADNLANFQEGLRATHEGARSHNIVLGHSYGSTVIGHTARDHPDFAANVDDVVLVASPGVGVQNVNDLHLAPNQVHATVAAHDIINATNIDYPGIGDPLGPDPAAPAFGADIFTSDPGATGPDATADLNPAVHSEYWQPRSTSLRNMGKIIVGESAN